MLNQEIYRGRAITSPDSTILIPLLLRFILFFALQATIQLQLLSVVVDVAEAGSASWSWTFLPTTTSVCRWPTLMPDL